MATLAGSSRNQDLGEFSGLFYLSIKFNLNLIVEIYPGLLAVGSSIDFKCASSMGSLENVHSLFIEPTSISLGFNLRD